MITVNNNVSSKHNNNHNNNSNTNNNCVHFCTSVRIARCASYRAQPLEDLEASPSNKKVPGPPNPWNKYCAGD